MKCVEGGRVGEEREEVEKGGGEWREEGMVRVRGREKKKKMVKGIAGGVERKGHHKGMHETGGN